MPIPWNRDPPGAGPRIERNVENLLQRLVRDAPARGEPSVELAKDWHRALFEGVELPVPYYAGEIRDDDPQYPELVGYEVRVGAHPGVPAREVPAELDRFEQRMRRAVGRLDEALPVGEAPGTAGLVGSVVTLCALAHGEWARIHPFANGNGRTARLWVAWCSLRYGLPIFARLHPRPDDEQYARAAAASMQGDHRETVELFADWLEEQLGEGPPGD